MLKYSELSPAQKKVVSEMNQGHELCYVKSTLQFVISNGQFTWAVEWRTANALINRHYIMRYGESDAFIYYCLNVNFLTVENLDAMKEGSK